MRCRLAYSGIPFSAQLVGPFIALPRAPFPPAGSSLDADQATTIPSQSRSGFQLRQGYATVAEKSSLNRYGTEPMPALRHGDEGT